MLNLTLSRRRNCHECRHGRPVDEDGLVIVVGQQNSDDMFPRDCLAVTAAQAPTDADPLGQIQAIGLGYLSWARANPEHFKVVSQRNLVDLDARAKELNDDIRNRMIGLLAMARETNQMRQGLNPATVLLSCRATVYGLARMYVDGHFPEWQPDGDPTDWMTRSLTLFIQTLRNEPR